MPMVREQQVAAVRLGMTRSQQAAGNITAAQEACRIWERLFRQPREYGERSDILLSDTKIRGLCFAMYASCLVRVGRDEDALDRFDHAAKLLQQSTSDESSSSTNSTRDDIIMGKASSLQRLLRYDEAKTLFQQILSSSSTILTTRERAACSAATCSMRLGDLTEALQTVSTFLHDDHQTAAVQNMEAYSSSYSMLAILSYLLQPKLVLGNKSLFSMLEDCATLDPVCYWIWLTKSSNKAASDVLDSQNALDRWEGSFPFLERAAVNNGAFDSDPFLRILDDKVLLHKLLRGRPQAQELSRRFFPFGVILGSECTVPDLLNQISSELAEAPSFWMLKKRAGYGSHGNRLVRCRTKEDLQKVISSTLATKQDREEVLLQQLISHQFLLQDRKFSVRIYVIYFPVSRHARFGWPDIFVSKLGLVKLASLAVDTNSTLWNLSYHDDRLARMHMTNSGREVTMEQYDLEYLRAAFQQAGICPSRWWDGIIHAVRSVFELYQAEIENLSLLDASCQGGLMQVSPQWSVARQKLADLGIPKILGVDFVVDKSGRSWLVEVNRFPGLEPRGETDQKVKHQVVAGAWQLALKRHSLDTFRAATCSTENASTCLSYFDKVEPLT